MGWFQKMHQVTQFDQKACLKPYIDMKTKLRTEAKNGFERDFFELMKNAVLETLCKIWETI